MYILLGTSYIYGHLRGAEDIKLYAAGQIAALGKPVVPEVNR